MCVACSHVELINRERKRSTTYLLRSCDASCALALEQAFKIIENPDMTSKLFDTCLLEPKHSKLFISTLVEERRADFAQKFSIMGMVG